MSHSDGRSRLDQVAALWLEAMALLAAEANRLEEAARLTAALQVLRRGFGTDEAPTQSATRPRRLEVAPLELASADGGPVSRDLAYNSSAAAGRLRAVPSNPALLTSREQQVATLIAYGLTNRDIARELVISERTVDTHIGNILSKLRLTSRVQVAAWAVEHHLGAS
jgi:DNA-binding NarL/FixJ family response regulator